jgi:hypothetical protein
VPSPFAFTVEAEMDERRGLSASTIPALVPASNSDSGSAMGGGTSLGRGRTGASAGGDEYESSMTSDDIFPSAPVPPSTFPFPFAPTAVEEWSARLTVVAAEVAVALGLREGSSTLFGAPGSSFPF